LFILRAGGQSLGWGFQLQSPAFVAILAGLVFLMGLNMLGVFQIGTGLVALGNVLPARGRLSSFVSGALAVVIATPCTAPFMGAALAVALTLTWGAALAVFTALALGFAAPTVILCLSPRLLKAMPKAGPWMESFKQAMSFPLFGTVVWLSWVFARQTSPEAAVRFWSGLLLLSIAAWLYGRWGQSMTVRRGRTLGMLGAMAAMTLGTTLLIVGAGVLGTRPQSLWPEWSEQAVDKARQEGKIVFVDFTAAWCVTCQVNERLVLSRSDVQADFAKRQVVTLKADWTSRDSRITETLSALGRSGVPVYVVYGHNAPPLILPTVLTPALIREALDKAEATRIK
jgi:thiol:disulfide interchange protein DsbD